MAEIKDFPVYMVDAGNAAAMSAVKKICEGAKPGAVIPLTSAEFKAMQKGVIKLSVEVE